MGRGGAEENGDDILPWEKRPAERLRSEGWAGVDGLHRWR